MKKESDLYWNHGKTLNEIADYFNVSYSTMYRRFQSAGIPLRSRVENGRKAAPNLDHNRQNNQISNLQVMTRGQHTRLHCLENPQQKDSLTGRFI